MTSRRLVWRASRGFESARALRTRSTRSFGRNGARDPLVVYSFAPLASSSVLYIMMFFKTLIGVRHFVVVVVS